MNSQFCIETYSYIKSAEEIDISSLPPLTRRRLSALDKAVYTTMSKVWDKRVENIVFSSQHGEVNRLDTILEQCNTLGEVSPAQFSSSVHNSAVSFFTQYHKLNIPYYALSAGKNSLSSGLLNAVMSNKITLFTYADVKEKIKSVSCIILPNKSGFEFCNNKKEYSTFEDFIDFLNGKDDFYNTEFGSYTRN